MILYLDASALVKRYISENGSTQVNDWIAAADVVITNIITRTEVAAALCRAERLNVLSHSETKRALDLFRSEWEGFHRLPVTEATVVRGDILVSQYNLRGYDAVHLAAAVLWQEVSGDPVTIASFDNQLCEAARQIGMKVLP